MPEHDFRMTNGRANDPRLREVGPLAAGIWALSGSWSCLAGTDGWVAAHYVKSWPGGAGAAKKLVRVGLWTEHRRGTQDGWLFDQEEWLREQRLAAEVEREREKARGRQQEKRQRDKDAALRASGQLTTGPMIVSTGVPRDEEEPADGQDDEPVTASVTRDIERTSRSAVTRDVTHMRHGEHSRPPIPSPSLEGFSEEEGTRSERADSPASSSHDPLDEEPPAAPERWQPSQPQRSAHGEFVTWLRGLSAAELAALDRRCDLHAQAAPGTSTPSCTDCARRRRVIERVVEDQRLHAQQTVTDVSVRRRVCLACDELGFRLGDDRRPVEPLERCDHPDVPVTAAALAGARR